MQQKLGQELLCNMCEDVLALGSQLQSCGTASPDGKRPLLLVDTHLFAHQLWAADGGRHICH